MKLALFFTRGVSLQHWIESGLFEREKLIYEKHLDQGNLSKVYWFTYGINDALLGEQLKTEGRLYKGIEVISMPAFFKGRIGILIYSLLIPFLRYPLLRQMGIFKTNQMDGSWSAVIAKCLFGKPLIVRTGYTWSLFREKENVERYKLWLINRIEAFAYKNATMSVVSTQSQMQYVVEHYSLPENKITVVPNLIDTQLFAPEETNSKYFDRIVFVGRLKEQKNLFNLIEAVSQAGLILDIYGKGKLKKELELHSENCGAKVNFMGVVPNSSLNEILNHYKYYILPSHYEGMPKTLLEAMSCGLLCIGTDVPGINEIIDDGINGYLARGTETDAVLKGIKRAVGSNNTQKIIKDAREHIVNEFSLENVISQEASIFRVLLGGSIRPLHEIL